MSFKLTQPVIRLDTKKDLSTASNPEIHFRKPDGTVGEWPATISGTKLEYQASSNDLSDNGIWAFQSVVNFGSHVQKGSIKKIQIQNPIKTD